MKKLYTTPEYKLWQKRRLRKIEKKLRKKQLSVNRDKRTGIQKKNKTHHPLMDIKKPVDAPSDLRLMENTVGCLSFFRDLRSEEYLSKRRNVKFVVVSLKDVTQIDYGTISILTEIGDDLKFKGVILKSFLPDNPECKNFMIESGYLNNLFDDKGMPFEKTEKSELMFFEKGSGVLSTADNKRISLMVKNVVNHLTGELKYCLPVKTIILEICGNSIEWGGTDNRQWLFGVKYESEKVIFTVTDVGKGILDTLHRKYKDKISDIFRIQTNDKILIGAFNKKYGSNTQEVNRNKGLPSVKSNFDQGIIRELKVLTNNVILHFDNVSYSRAFERGTPRFKGTFYQWSMTKECINNISIGSNENN